MPVFFSVFIKSVLNDGAGLSMKRNPVAGQLEKQKVIML
jgi:hypothetical protein